MRGLFRWCSGSAAAAAVLLVTVFGLTTGPAHAIGVAAAQARPQPVTAAAIGPMEADPQPTVPPITEVCRKCLAPDDAICWELPPYLCQIQVTIGWIPRSDVTVHFTTIDDSARADVDYVRVKDGVVTIPAGSQQGTGTVELIPAKPEVGDRSFLIELFGPSDGVIEQDRAVVTLSAGPPGKTPPGKG